MKKWLLSGAFLAVALLLSFPIKASAEESYVRMYRVYNPNTGEHFYTSNVDERIFLVNLGWNDEGVAWAAPKESSVPVYRLYNPNAGDHHYTISDVERDSLINAGWSYEGILCYSAGSEDRIPLYRNYNPNAIAGAHNYTTSEVEYKHLNEEGWSDEGIGWYALNKNLSKVVGTNDAYASFETDLVLNGSGDGYHAKIVLTDATGARAVSFGIQYSYNLKGTARKLGYVEKINTNCAFLVENVMGNHTDAGTTGKEYTFVKDAVPGQTYHVNLSWYEDNTLRFYVDGVEVWHTKSTLDKPFYFSVEGSAMHNGDTIDASFSDVVVYANGSDGYRGFYSSWNDVYADFFGLDVKMVQSGVEENAGSPFYTNGFPSQHCSFTVTGTVYMDTENNGEICPVTNKLWDWDTSFYAVEPRTKTTQHPLSAVATIAQMRPVE